MTKGAGPRCDAIALLYGTLWSIISLQEGHAAFTHGGCLEGCRIR